VVSAISRSARTVSPESPDRTLLQYAAMLFEEASFGSPWVLSLKFVTKHKLAREQDVLMMTAIRVEGHWHQAAAVLPEVEDRAVGSADRNSMRPH
jgi:hypothetical protein